MSKKLRIGKCNLCGEQKKLCRAHIIPKFLFKELHISLSCFNPYPVKSHNGQYDPDILCANCDNVINEFDHFACKTLFSSRIENTGELLGRRIIGYRLKNKADYRKIDLFFISILWKTSISSQTRCNKSILGTYQEHAKKAILNKNFDYHKYFLIIIKHYADLKDPIYFLSKKIRINGRAFYFLFIGFFGVYIKCDQQEMPKDFLLNNFSTNKNVFFTDGIFKNSNEERMFSALTNRIRKHCLSNLKQ